MATSREAEILNVPSPSTGPEPNAGERSARRTFESEANGILFIASLISNGIDVQPGDRYSMQTQHATLTIDVTHAHLNAAHRFLRAMAADTD